MIRVQAVRGLLASRAFLCVAVCVFAVVFFGGGTRAPCAIAGPFKGTSKASGIEKALIDADLADRKVTAARGVNSRSVGLTVAQRTPGRAQGAAATPQANTSREPRSSVKKPPGSGNGTGGGKARNADPVDEKSKAGAGGKANGGGDKSTSGGETAGAGSDKSKKPADGPPMGSKPANFDDNDKDFQLYLDRLMIAESGGRDTARNSRSTAVGSYQFIKSTFLSVARRNFPDDVKGMTDRQILALRTDRAFARKAAAAYSRENAAYLAAEGRTTNYGNLRLAFLMGPAGAVRVLKAKPGSVLAKLLDRSVLRANPFMRRLTAGELIARCHREISIDPSRQLSVAGLPKVKRGPKIKVRCNLSRPSCRKWLALKRKRLAAKGRKARKSAPRRKKRESASR